MTVYPPIIPQDTNTGYIERIGLALGTYTGYTKVGPQIGLDITGVPSTKKERRGYLVFPTANALPCRAVVTKIEIDVSVELTSSTPGFPTTWDQDYYVGVDIINDDLTTNESAIWNSADWLRVLADTGQPTSETLTLGNGVFSKAVKKFDCTKNYQVAIVDNSGYTGTGVFNTILYGSAGGRSTTLLVTYRVAGIYHCKAFNAKIYTE